MEPLQIFKVVTQLGLLLSLIAMVWSMRHLHRLTKALKPDRSEKQPFPGSAWLRYPYNRLDRDQSNIRRAKNIIWLHTVTAAVFWVVGLAAHLGWLNAWLQP